MIKSRKRKTIKYISQGHDILIFFLDDGIERIVIHDVLDGLLLFAGSKHTCDGGDRQTDAERYGQFSEFFHFELLFYINLSKIRP